MSLCSCSTALPQVTGTKCGDNFNGINLAAFVKLGDLPTDVFDDATKVAVKTNWTTALGQTTKKVIISPMLYNFSSTPGDANTWDDGMGGSIYISTADTEITAELRKSSVSVVAGLKDLTCLAENGNLGVVFFTESGGIVAKNGFAPVPVKYAHVSDRVIGSFSEPDYSTLTIRLASGWSNNIAETALTNWVGTDLLA